MEQLTDEVEKRIRSRIEEIEALGDVEDLCRQGYFRDIFHRAMEESHREIEKGHVPVVGVNVHQLHEQDDVLLRDLASTKVEPAHSHTARIEAFRRSRNLARVRNGLSGVSQAMGSSGNVVEAIITAMDSDATVGEITTTLRRSVGMSSDPFDQPLPNVG